MPYTENNCEWTCHSAYRKVTIKGVDICQPGLGVKLASLQQSGDSSGSRRAAPATCGRVEVFDYQSEEWGTVCDDSWEDVDAQVVCTELGCSGDGTAVQQFGGGSGAIWLDDVLCDGTETSLSACQSAGWGQHNCQHSEDAGACCVGINAQTGTCAS